MKRAIILSILAICICSMAVTGSNPFVPTTKGMILEYANYDNKGNLKGYTVQTVTDVRESGGRTVVEINDRSLDKQRAETNSSTLTYTVTPGNISMDMAGLISDANSSESANQRSVRVEGDITYPVALAVGKRWPEQTMHLFMKKRNGKESRLGEVKYYNRAVTAEERVTTPAGTFDCYRFTETMQEKMMVIFRETHISVKWLAEGVGEIRSEEYTGKNVLESRSELISVKMP